MSDTRIKGVKDFTAVIVCGVIALCGAFILFSFGGVHYVVRKSWNIINPILERLTAIYFKVIGLVMGYVLLGLVFGGTWVFFKECRQSHNERV